jgi:hypothetical protein
VLQNRVQNRLGKDIQDSEPSLAPNYVVGMMGYGVDLSSLGTLAKYLGFGTLPSFPEDGE